MLKNILLIIGSVICTGWGAAHIIPTKNVLKGYAELPRDKKRVIAMEWIAEGITLCFIGIMVFILAVMGLALSPAGVVVIICAVVMLFLLALLTFFTGARTPIVPIKICPYVKTFAALLYIIAVAI